MKIMIIIAMALAASACVGVVTETRVSDAGGAVATASDVAFLDVYRLGPADRVRILVYGEPTMTGEYAVNDQGIIAFPLIGEVPAGGATIDEFKQRIEAQLSEGFINDASVAAEIVRFRPYYIMGEVGRAGEYEYSAGLTALKAIAAAEGFTYRANKSVVYIKRFDGDEELKLKLSPEVRVYPGDVVRVGERFF